MRGDPGSTRHHQPAVPEAVTDDQWLTQTQAWIQAGGTYRVRPAIAPAVALCALGLFFPALVILLGLAFSDLFLVFAAGFIALVPLAVIVLLIVYRRNACLYVDKTGIGRIGLRGSVVALCPRTGLGSIRIQKGSYEAWLGDALHPHGTWDDNVMYVLDHRGKEVFRVTLHVWTPRQVELLSRLAQAE